MVCFLILLAKSRSASHSGSCAAAASWSMRTFQNVLSWRATFSGFLLNAAAFFACSVLIARFFLVYVLL